MENDGKIGLWTYSFALGRSCPSPGNPLMEITVNGIVARLKALAPEQETTVSGIRASYDDVLSTTGAALFTEAIFERLAESNGTMSTWQNITGMTEPRLVDDGTYFLLRDQLFLFFPNPRSGYNYGDGSPQKVSIPRICMYNLRSLWKKSEVSKKKTTVMLIFRAFATVLILPISAFGSGQAHSRSGSPEEPTAFVHRLFNFSRAPGKPTTLQRMSRSLPILLKATRNCRRHQMTTDT